MDVQRCLYVNIKASGCGIDPVTYAKLINYIFITIMQSQQTRALLSQILTAYQIRMMQ